VPARSIAEAAVGAGLRAGPFHRLDVRAATEGGPYDCATSASASSTSRCGSRRLSTHRAGIVPAPNRARAQPPRRRRWCRYRRPARRPAPATPRGRLPPSPPTARPSSPAACSRFRVRGRAASSPASRPGRPGSRPRSAPRRASRRAPRAPAGARCTSHLPAPAASATLRATQLITQRGSKCVTRHERADSSTSTAPFRCQRRATGAQRMTAPFPAARGWVSSQARREASAAGHAALPGSTMR